MISILTLALALSTTTMTEHDYPIRPVPFHAVRIDDGFWTPRLETNRRVTVRYDFDKCESTGRIDNFAKAGGRLEGEFIGRRYDDSDVFKVIEGASYALALADDPELDLYLDGVIAKIAAAQEDDGYLFTIRTLNPDDPPEAIGPERWSYLAQSHELYNVGHLYEAAVAHFFATGKRSLLDVALKNADLVASVFGPNGRHDVPGHEEIEIGLAKLYRVTGEAKYLDLAKFFLDQRGRADGHELYGDDSQDHMPVVEQTEAVGHAVRAGYLYTAMADVAALTGDATYRTAIDRLWTDVVSRKMYVTGGIGSTSSGEAFGAPYELPNASAYTETCAAIANALWNHRMFLLHGDSRYIDVLERVIYNGFLSGVSLGGDTFFYPNPLAWDGRRPFNQGVRGRSPWFSCACCPVNVVRFLPSIAGMIFASRDDAAYVNLYIGGEGRVPVGGEDVSVKIETRYPWDGAVRVTVTPETVSRFEVRLRVPGWALGRPVPSDLYRELLPGATSFEIRVNGDPVPVPLLVNGYARLSRQWTPGDVVELELPMKVRRMVAHDAVADDRGRVALERGPLVFCLEGIDHDGDVRDVVLRDHDVVDARWRDDLLGGAIVLEGRSARARRTAAGALSLDEARLTAIPYALWAHRALGPMTVWIPRDVVHARIPPLPTLASRSAASASHCFSHDTVDALNDEVEPNGSNDHDVPRLTFWDHRGTAEWVQYDLPEPAELSGVAVYWFDDTGRGACRVPKAWRVRVDDGAGFHLVSARLAFGVDLDRYNVVDFAPRVVRRIRLEVDLQDAASAGILEWRLRTPTDE